MSSPVSPVSDVRPPARKKRRVGVIVGVAIAVVAAGALVVGLLLVGGVTRQVPQFPSLAEHPDSSLQGTVAYYSEQNPQCVKVVAAAGRPVKTFCLKWPVPKIGTKEAKQGKPFGPQLAWLPGGRLQVTMFRMAAPEKPGAVPALHRGWQKIIDVRTGKVEDVPAADVPSQPTRSTRMVSPSGQRISWTSHDGRIKVMLTDRNGTRTLLSAQGPGEYTYWLNSAFWAPNWQWIAADDGRILIITTGHAPVTRVLSTESRSVTLGLAPALAVTGENILAPSR
jgi:hypothetical protein